MKISKEYIIDMYYKYTRLLGVMLITAVMTASTSIAGIQPLNLLSLKNFVIIAGSTITGVPPVTVTGNVGLSPAAGSYVAGFDGTNVVGTLYVVDASGPAGSVIDATLLQTAKSDLTTAYTEAANRTPVPTGTFLNPGAGNIGGMNLVAGLYKFTGAADITGADVTLTGSATDVWIFQIGSSLNLGSGIKIILAGGAQAANIFWQVGTSATLGTYSVFKGTILADQSVSLGTGASIEGRALAFSAAVTMASGVTSTKATLSPMFSADSLQVRFGNVNNLSSKTDTVTVSNTGGADLIITNVTSSNSSFTISSTTGTITPGSTKKFYITYSPNANGTQSANIIFTHNAAKPKDTITVSGAGVSPFFLANKQNINFGNVRNNTTKLDSVSVTNTGTANLIITSVTSSNTRFTISSGTATIKPDSTQKFYITFAPLVDGSQSGTIIFNHNALKPKDTITVSGTGVSPLFSVTPTTLNFGNVRNNITNRDSVTVSNSGTTDLIITSVTSSNALFTISATSGTITPGSKQKFYITFTPLIDGFQTSTIIFNHNALKSKDTITVSGTGVSPKFAVNPSSLNFGSVINGTTKLDSITVTNTGTADLIISSFISTNSRFTIKALTATIAPNVSRKFYITYTPLVPGVDDGFIRFVFNATNAKDSIRVTGTGTGNPTFPLFSANPKSIDFGNVTNGTTKTDSVTVSNPGTADLIIFGVAASNVFYTVEPSYAVIRMGLSQKFFVTFAPLTPGLQSGSVYFSSNVVNAKDSISVTGNGIGVDIAPKFSINTSNLDFGNVLIGTTKQKSVYVSNTGSSNLIIADIISSNAQYAVTPIIGTIEPNATKEFFITFAPKAIGQVNAELSFSHSVGKDILKVTGNGIADSVQVITIKAARDLPIGTEITVEGIVTRTLGIYTRIQDATGGLTLFQESGVFFNAVQNSEIAMGDKIRIQGRISEKDFLKVITSDDLISHLRISRLNTLPAPAVLTLVEIALNGEKYESCLVKVENITMDSDSDLTFRELKIYEITDTTDKTNTVVVSIGKNSDTYMVGMPIYNKLATFEGVLSQATSRSICGYQLVPILSSDLRFGPTGISTPIAGNQFTLADNYPNPFNSSTTIQYTIEQGDVVSLKVFTMLGKEVATLVSGYQNAGTHSVAFSANETTSIGNEVYFYRLEVGTFVSAKHMIFMK